MSINYNKIRGRIKEVYGSESAFAEAVSMTKQNMSLKLNGKVAFDQPTISKWCKMLHIEPEEIHLYFFA